MLTDYISCLGNDCPIKEKCKRFTGLNESLYQSWFTEIPGKWEPDDEHDIMVFDCDMFWGEAQDSIMNQLNEIMK